MGASEDGYATERSEVAYRGRLSNVRIDHVRMPDGETRPREIVEHLSAVAVVPVDGDGQVVLVRQYRHPFQRYFLELPAGILDVEGESPEAAARRELAEEIGMEAGVVERLLQFENSAGWTDETTTIYLARDLRAAGELGGFTPHGEEADMEVVRFPLSQAAAMAAGGQITDAKTVIGLLVAQRRLTEQPAGSQ